MFLFAIFAFLQLIVIYFATAAMMTILLMTINLQRACFDPLDLKGVMFHDLNLFCANIFEIDLFELLGNILEKLDEL